MTDRPLTFLTLSTGHTVLSSRAEIATPVIARIQQAIAGDGRLWADFTIQTEINDGQARFVIAAFGCRLSVCFVCWKREHSARAWQAMLADPVIAELPALLMPEYQPVTPWLAVALPMSMITMVQARGLADYIESLSVLGDVERCVAWAIIDQQAHAS